MCWRDYIVEIGKRLGVCVQKTDITWFLFLPADY